MAAAWTAYGVVQAVLLLLLVLRLLRSLAFQPHLGIVSRTLYRVMAPIAHLVLIIGVLLVMFAAMATLCVGFRIRGASDLGESIYNIFMQMLGGDTVHSLLLLDGSSKSGIEWLLAGLLSVCQVRPVR